MKNIIFPFRLTFPTRAYINNIRNPCVPLRKAADALEGIIPSIQKSQRRQKRLRASYSSQFAVLKKVDKKSKEYMIKKRKMNRTMAEYNEAISTLEELRIQGIEMLWEIQWMVLTLMYRLVKDIDRLHSIVWRISFSREHRAEGLTFKAHTIGHVNNLKSEVIAQIKSNWNTSKFHENQVLSPQIFKELSPQKTSVMLLDMRGMTITIDQYNRFIQPVFDAIRGLHRRVNTHSKKLDKKMTDMSEESDNDAAEIYEALTSHAHTMQEKVGVAIETLHGRFLEIEKLAHRSKILIHRFHVYHIGHDRRPENLFQKRLDRITKLWMRLFYDANHIIEFKHPKKKLAA